MKKKLTIGLFIDNFYPLVDGVVLVVDHLARELSKDNDVYVVAPYEKECDDSDLPYTVIRVTSYPVPGLEYRMNIPQGRLSRAYRKLKKIPFDVIHVHSPFTIGTLGVKLAKEKGIPSICTMHSRFDFELRKKIPNETIIYGVIHHYIQTFNACDMGIAINKAMIKVFRDYGYTGETTLIYNGTDLEENTDLNLEDSIREEYHLTKEIPILLFTGRITAVKNIFFILDVLKQLSDKGIKYQMLFVGSGEDEGKLLSKIHEYGLSDQIHLTGKIMDRKKLSAIYHMSTLFLFPSLFDASSLVQIEAAINETPALFIEGSVTSDTVTPDVNGFVAPNDIDLYTEKVFYLLKHPEEIQKVGKNAKKMLGRKWSDLAKETYDLYVSEIEKKHE